MKKFFLVVILTIIISNNTYSQGCCSGGSGSPIAGGTSQGVLLDRQAEIGFNWQSINSNKFLTGDKPAMDFLKNYNSNYLYSRFAYGISKNFTMSLESGYYFNKTQIGLGNEKINSSGIADLIIFPRYDVYNSTREKTRTEITLGMGMKIPMGKYLDSFVTFTNPATGKKYYAAMPPAVMPTTGSNDMILYGFLYRGYPQKDFRIFANLLYIHKGWNALGQKFGDYAGIDLFAGKTFFRKIGVTLQVRGEWVDVMQHDKNIDMLAVYNLDVNSTGGKKIIFAPQLNYSLGPFSFYALTELPLYQYINGTAIASQYLFTLGITYRFFVIKPNG